MPMGFHNSSAIQHRCLESSLWDYIGKISHIYLDDIIIWSNNLQEHIKINIILTTLWKVCVFINAKKSVLFITDVKFLVHQIFLQGLKLVSVKLEKF